jgi:hypothetical protein
MTGGWPTQNVVHQLNQEFSDSSNQNTHNIGKATRGGTYSDMYIADFSFVDGLQLAPSNFGETNDNGVWIPKKPSVSAWGDNGFFLEFKQTGTGTAGSGTVGADTSGNDNHFTSSGIAATDVTVDTPTNNFATLNPLFNSDALSQTPTLSEGNTSFTSTSSSTQGASSVGTIAPNSGKWYWETKQTASVSNGFASGVRVLEGYYPTGAVDSSFYGDNSTFGGFGYGYNYNGGHVLHNAGFSTTNQGSSVSTNQIVGHALDLDNGALYFSINGTWQASSDPESGASKTNAQHSFTVDGSYASAVYGYSSANFQMNFGNAPYSISSGNSDANGYGNFEYAVPSGYYALCTKNLAEYG